jgi:hypothetical protein
VIAAIICRRSRSTGPDETAATGDDAASAASSSGAAAVEIEDGVDDRQAGAWLRISQGEVERTRIRDVQESASPLVLRHRVMGKRS